MLLSLLTRYCSSYRKLSVTEGCCERIWVHVGRERSTLSLEDFIHSECWRLYHAGDPKIKFLLSPSPSPALSLFLFRNCIQVLKSLKTQFEINDYLLEWVDRSVESNIVSHYSSITKNIVSWCESLYYFKILLQVLTLGHKQSFNLKYTFEMLK